ncbi:MAG: hypothetical protein K6T35_14260, partial [Meiothermus silvanus]|nr:hypothetical protein [Allomeiothermus silvanus]
YRARSSDAIWRAIVVLPTPTSPQEERGVLRGQLHQPPPVAPLPALPAPPTVPAPAPSAPKPRPLTLQQRLQASGWSVEAVAAGAEPNVLLSHRGERGLYRVGETLEERIRIERIESNRVILARDGERAALEVLP